jgi:heterodisulfide reductase subunit A-like polyferredoxin
MANVVARSAFINQVDEALCIGCEDCLDTCQFMALSLQEFVIHVDQMRCVGCGVCVANCQEDALGLVRRPPEEILPVPGSESDWRVQRSGARGIELQRVL